MPLNIPLFFGKAEKGSHSEHLVQRLCVGSGIIGLGPYVSRRTWSCGAKAGVH